MAEQTENEQSYNPMQRVKRYFFSMRNGIIAETLRKGGSPFKYIFGLNIPQLGEAAAMFGKDNELAEKLWANNTTRESMLLAPMLMPDETFGIDNAKVWISQVSSPEVADILCHRLLRRLPFAGELAAEYSRPSHSDLERYTAGRLAINLFDNNSFDTAAVLAELEKESGPFTTAIARQLAMRFEDL